MYKINIIILLLLLYSKFMFVNIIKIQIENVLNIPLNLIVVN